MSLPRWDTATMAAPDDHARRPEDVRGQRRTATASLIAAMVLVVLKLGAGLASGSLALISAGVESSGDVLAALLTLGAIRLASRGADLEHNYGHRRAENLAALGEAAIVAAGAGIIAFEAIRQIAGGGHDVDAAWYVFAVIGVAVVIDVARIVTSLRAARRYDSAALRSNAYNFAGDLAGSIAVIAGLGLVSAGVDSGDAIAALAIAAVVLVGVGRLVTENARALMDYAPPASREAIVAAIEAEDESVELRRLRLRDVGGRLFVDVTLGLPPAQAVTAGHLLVDRIEAAIGTIAPGSDVVVHVEPRDHGVALHERVTAAALTDPDVREVHDVSVFTRDDRHVVASLHLKFSTHLSLQEAHDAAERVEAAIRALDGRIEAVHTHLEPVGTTIAVRDGDDGHGRRIALQATAEALLGTAVTDIELRDTDAGPVVFLTIPIDSALGLTAAHERAGELESALRMRHPDLVEVVVHTEPERR